MNYYEKKKPSLFPSSFSTDKPVLTFSLAKEPCRRAACNVVHEQQPQRRRRVTAASASCGLHLTAPIPPSSSLLWPQGGLLFLLISQVIHSNRDFTSVTVDWHGPAFLQVPGSLAVLPSPALHQLKTQAQENLHFPKRAAIQRHFTFIPACLSAHMPWVWTDSYGNGLLHPETGHLEVGRERFGS